MDDPVGNSFLQGGGLSEDDPALTVSHYQRSPEQDQRLGLGEEVAEDADSHEDKVLFLSVEAAEPPKYGTCHTIPFISTCHFVLYREVVHYREVALSEVTKL